MLLLAGLFDWFGGGKYHYKLTVEVETPDGIRTGSAVREVVYTEDLIAKYLIKLPDAGVVSVRQHGEAVVVDLPGGQTLFALLPLNGYEPLQAAFGNDAPATVDAAVADGRIATLAATHGFAAYNNGFGYDDHVSNYPMLVRFKDQRDPTSVALVDPSDLAASFGADVRLRRITLQMTDEDVTVGIEKRLSWLPTIYKMRIGSNFRPLEIPVGDFHGLFTTEKSK